MSADYKDNNIWLMKGDCLERMKEIPDKSVDAIITDPPYGTTACKWDSIIPFAPMWEQLKRIIKPNGAIVLFGSQPFTSAMIMSNPKMFKYEWIWQKTNAVDFALAKKRARKMHENVCVFYDKRPTYNPQMQAGRPYVDKARRRSNSIHDSEMPKLGIINDGVRYPSSVQLFSNGNNGRIHPTQKPVALMEYLIKTYTNEGETVLDFTAGSGTTGIAAINTNRNAILIERDPKYCEIIKQRIAEVEKEKQNNLFAGDL